MGLGLGLGGGAVWVVEVVLVELEVDELLELLVELWLELLLLELDELLGGGQDSDVLDTGAGRPSEDSGVPGGSWKYSVCPVVRTTVTVQSAAEAVGSTAKPNTENTAPAVIAATFSFGRFNTGALSPPALRDAATRHAQGACRAS